MKRDIKKILKLFMKTLPFLVAMCYNKGVKRREVLNMKMMNMFTPFNLRAIKKSRPPNS
jgi:hypothetical protein